MLACLGTATTFTATKMGLHPLPHLIMIQKNGATLVRKSLFISLIACLSLSPFSYLWAWGGDYIIGESGKIQTGQSDWSSGLVDLMNSSGCFHGHWVNANDEFFYQGDTALLNQFLKRYSTLNDTPLTVIIHAGSFRRSALWGEKPDKPYDWKLLVQKHGWGAPETSNSPNEKYVVTVDVWIDRGIRLADLHVPDNVTIHDGNEIEDFISKHKVKQDKVIQDKK
jgi:hypothetical protein